MDSFDHTLSYLSYAPTQLEEENNVIIKSNRETIESIADIINDSLDKKNKDKTFICDFGIDNHCVQVLVSNGEATIINTGYDFEYIGKEIEEKFQEKYNKKIEVKQFRSSLQNAGNCVLCSKIMTRLLLSQYKKHKNVYNTLSKDLNKLQKLSKDLIEDKEKTDEDKIKYVRELDYEDFKKYRNLIRIAAEASVKVYNNNKRNFENIVDESFKKLLTIFNDVGKEKNSMIEH